MGKDKKVDVLFQTRVISMVGTLNLFLDLELTLTWRQASLVSSKAQGHGMNHAQRIREWILKYILHNELPLHRLGQLRWTTLEDEDLAQEIMLRITEKVRGRHLKASDVIDIVESPEVQVILRQKGVDKPSISERTTRHWLAGLGWQYGKTKMACMLMAMKGTMLWSIVIDSSAAGKNMNVASINGTMMATSSRGQTAFRSQTLAFDSSPSHTTS